MNDPEACVHGLPLKGGCFFCGTKSFEATAFTREPRNPPAAESRPSYIRRDSSQRGAAASHREEGRHEWDNRTSVENFARLWDAINSKRSPWERNDLVWRIAFKRLDRT